MSHTPTALLLGALIVSSSIAASASNQLWYAAEASSWNEALPVGNGRLGAMVFGGAISERLQLNESTLWSGRPRVWDNPEARVYLPQVRRAVQGGRHQEADRLSKHMQGPYTESYMPMGDLRFQVSLPGPVRNYRRELDLDRAIAGVQFESGGIIFKREVFANAPSNVLVAHWTSNRPAALSFTIDLSSQLHGTVSVASPNGLVLDGEAPSHVEPNYRREFDDAHAIQYSDDPGKRGMGFQIRVQVLATGGSVRHESSRISVQNADSVTILVTAATGYRGFDKPPSPAAKAAVVDETYEVLLRTHLADYRPIFGRFQLQLGTADNARPTDQRLKTGIQNDPGLAAVLAQYSRYLMISSSRPGGLPGNLKGIWNDRLRPEWSANWALNHDAEMYYYAVETTNTAEMHKPFLDFIEGLAVNGRRTAVTNYGARGWTAHHNSDIWRQTGAAGDWGQGNPHWALFMMAGPWLSGHFWEHYSFSGDKVFLGQRAWPLMKEAALFCLDMLVDDGKGHLVTNPSVSPENIFIDDHGMPGQISEGATVDMSLMWDLFSNVIEASRILGREPEFAAQLAEVRSRLLPPKIGHDGVLQEWSKDWRSTDPGHRHLSQLYGVFPGRRFTPAKTPALAEAAKRSLLERDASSYGWSLAWKAASWARLGEGDQAWARLAKQITYQPGDNSTKSGWMYPNLFNADPPWVLLNGNMCALAALAEMLVQSHENNIHVLPALPSALTDGSVQGMRARKGFEVSLRWANRKVTELTIVSKLGAPARIRGMAKASVTANGRNVPVRLTSDGLIEFPTTPGTTYLLKALN